MLRKIPVNVVKHEAIDNGTKWLHEIATQVELIEFITMANTTLSKVSASYNLATHGGKEDAISIVQSCVHRRIVISRKPLAEKRLEVNSRCVSLAISRIS